MSFFSKLFSGKSARLAQIQQATELQAQQAEAARQQQVLQEQLSLASADRAEQLRILTEQGNTALTQAAETARLAQQQADEANYRASLTPADSEDARAAADQRMKKLQQKRGFTSTLVSRAGGGLGAAPVATQQLLGA